LVFLIADGLLIGVVIRAVIVPAVSAQALACNGQPATIIGTSGNDYVSGGDGKDYIDGGDDDDRLFAGRRDDALTGGVGIDRCDGGPHQNGDSAAVSQPTPVIGDAPNGRIAIRV
jgi:Ca2+-binding RTX toxin-like protein